MIKFGWLIFFAIALFSCTAKKELLVPVLLDFELYYPDEAREQGLEGTVVVRVFVGEDGKTKDVRLSQSSGNYLLDSAAVHTAKTFTFSPTMRGHKSVKSWVLVPIEFKLKMVHPEFWLTEVKILQNMLKNEYNKEWIQDLYNRYKEMIYVPRENKGIEINVCIKQTVLDATAKIWDGYWESYPANILLFIDILYRYPESFTSLEARADFNNFFKNEEVRIKNTLSEPNADSLINRLRKINEE